MSTRLRSALTLCLLFAAALTGSAQEATIVRLSLHGTVQPVSAEYLERGLKAAAALHAQMVLISLGTPGGLLDSTRLMVEAIENSPIPVAVFIAPSGSRAGSAGFFLLEAADIAAMAPGTNAGAAHPLITGGSRNPVLETKVENDTAAFLRSLVAQRGRNVQVAEDAVRGSKSYSDREALSLKLIDLVAPDENALLRQLDGRSIRRFDGSSITLRLTGAKIVPFPPSLRERVLTYLVNPDIAVLCLVIGALLFYLEVNIPGAIVPGAVGTLLVLLGVFGLNLLPIRHTALLLLFAAVCMLLLELKYTSHGLLGAVGALCLVAGLATLVDAPGSALRVHWATATGAGLGFGSISLMLGWIALRARRSKHRMGPLSMIGLRAVVRSALQPTGQVEVRGELWQARSMDRDPIPREATVVVRDLEGLTLIVQQQPLLKDPQIRSYREGQE